MRRRFRSDTLRRGAAGETCVLCGKPGAMACHLPHAVIGFPAGMGQKTHDWLVGDCCMDCHAKLDQGEWRNDHGIRMKALARTIERRLAQGLLVVPGEDHADDFPF